MDKVVYVIVLFMACCCLGCGQTRTSPKEEEVVRQYERFVTERESLKFGNRIVFEQTYVPLYNNNNRGPGAVGIVTYEFNDSALSICWGFHALLLKRKWRMGMLALDVGDKFYLYHVDVDRFKELKKRLKSDVPLVDYDRYLMESYLELAEICKGLPKARFDSCGIVKAQRDSEWVSVFEKEYQYNGVRLRALKSPYPFSYLVSYLPMEELPKSKRASREIAKKRLPPFLLHSLRDFLKYFGPTGNFDEIIQDNYGAM